MWADGVLLTLLCLALIHLSGDSPQNDTKGVEIPSLEEGTRPKRLAQSLLPYEAIRTYAPLNKELDI